MSEAPGDYVALVHIDQVGVWQDWYSSLVDDCRAIITEAVFTSRWALVEGYWLLGKRIATDEDYVRSARGNGAVLTDLSKSTGIGQRDLYRALQFYAKYPDLDKVPEGKNISWSKIVANYLPKSAGDDDDQPELSEIGWLKRRFNRYWSDPTAPDYARAKELITELSALFYAAAERANGKE